MTFTVSSPANLGGFSINPGADEQVTHGVNAAPGLLTNIPTNSSTDFISAGSESANSLAIMNTGNGSGSAYRVSSHAFAHIPAAA